MNKLIPILIGLLVLAGVDGLRQWLLGLSCKHLLWELNNQSAIEFVFGSKTKRMAHMKAIIGMSKKLTNKLQNDKIAVLMKVRQHQ